MMREPFIGFANEIGGDIVKCSKCGATWKGKEGTRCDWCDRRHARLLIEQTERVLEPPDSDSDDITHADKMMTWVQRLERAVTIGLITERHAQQAINRRRDADRRHDAA